jgi:hypothetical protein
MAQAEVLRVAPATVLLTAYYADPDPARRAEFVDCLARNASNELINEIHVFVEDGTPPDIDDEKIRLVEHGRRATYGDLFAYANAQLSGRRVAIANADIYFDEGLARLDAVDLPDTLLCVSRWDVEQDGSARFFEHGESQDAWIFDAPIRQFPCGFPLGVPGCDNRLAWEAEAAGLAVHNPARSLRAFHLHMSLVRRYTEHERIGGAALSVPADFLGPARAAPTASAAFREEMGYTVRTLEPGVSSHVNAERPLTTIPGELHGRRFTQVVAHVVAPVELEFLTPGKLFVLVGDDWWGCDSAREWLAENGFYERLPHVETAAGTGFEVWSLLGEPGDRFLVPTQVMLVGERLVRRRPR